MGVGIAALLALGAFLLILAFGHLPRVVSFGCAVVLALAVGGYAATGSPGLPGEAVVSPGGGRDAGRPSLASGPPEAFLAAAQAAAQEGRTRSATATLRAGLDLYPGEGRLWAQYGAMLVAGSEGVVSPAARLAFNRARMADGALPQPYYFEGLALAQQGRAREAIRFWEQARVRLPDEGPWREELDAQIRALRDSAQ